MLGRRALQVKHEASKNAMHRENERVLDSACVLLLKCSVAAC